MMQLEPGMRVRCVDASTYRGRKHPHLTEGKDYTVLDVRWQFVDIADDSGRKGGWFANRFKPIVRVKAGSRRTDYTGVDLASPAAQKIHNRIFRNMDAHFDRWKIGQ